MLRLHRSIGAGTLYVTHDQTEAMTMGDRVAVLQGGDPHTGVKPGGRVTFTVDPARLYFFDPDTGQAITG